MSVSNPPLRSVRTPNHMVASADQVATSAGVETFARGGNAVDAAIATNAAIAVTGPHLCGMGGDLFALVYDDGDVHALNASGRAGSGADAAAMRSAGLTEMPFRLDIRSVTVPGCVDGWLALHDRFGSLPLDQVLDPAIRLANDGFPASPLMIGALHLASDQGRANLHEIAEQAQTRGSRVRRPGVAAALAGVARGGRDTFYGGAFGEGLIEMGGGLFTASDLATVQAEWQPVLSGEAFGVTLHTAEPNSQGYLAIGGARLASQLDLPADPDDERWAHLLIEAATAAGRDRPSQLFDGADGRELLDMIDGRFDEIDVGRASGRWAPSNDGDTTYLCTAGRGVDGREMAVSLIQSNASGFGSHLVEPNTGINLHNRGMGFSIEEGHPAELAPGRRPPHTLLPMAATRDDGSLAAVFGTMGGDAQPQIMLQIAARLFHHRQSPARAIGAGRWALKGPATGFDTWTAPEGPGVSLEGHAPHDWLDALASRGHRTSGAPAWDSGFGHACAIVGGRDGMWVGSTDPRTVIGSCAGA
ncbi:gamma-glutamyltransferase family protein [Ilumatobacter coccineus]|nr:gamma-glutamyltransferase [Ilumatobacter coccineus]